MAQDLKTQEIVFVEVKTRSSGYYGNPSAAVKRKKMLAMTKVAHHWLRHHQLTNDYRFDIVAVLPKKIAHYTNISW